MSRASEAARAELAAEQAWWEALLPPGWKLLGWTGRASAMAYREGTSRMVAIDGEYASGLAARLRTEGKDG